VDSPCDDGSGYPTTHVALSGLEARATRSTLGHTDVPPVGFDDFGDDIHPEAGAIGVRRMPDVDVVRESVQPVGGAGRCVDGESVVRPFERDCSHVGKVRLVVDMENANAATDTMTLQAIA